MRKLIFLAGIAAAGAAIARRNSDAAPRWHANPGPAPSTDDAGAASPDEAMADAVEEPHVVTTPDEPLTETEIE